MRLAANTVSAYRSPALVSTTVPVLYARRDNRFFSVDRAPHSDVGSRIEQLHIVDAVTLPIAVFYLRQTDAERVPIVRGPNDERHGRRPTFLDNMTIRRYHHGSQMNFPSFQSQRLHEECVD